MTQNQIAWQQAQTAKDQAATRKAELEEAIRHNQIEEALSKGRSDLEAMAKYGAEASSLYTNPDTGRVEQLWHPFYTQAPGLLNQIGSVIGMLPGINFKI